MELRLIGVRFKPVGPVYDYINESLELDIGDGVIVKTERGTEYGEVVYIDKKFNKSKHSEENFYPLLKKADNKDIDKIIENQEIARKCADKTELFIKKLNLDMKLVDVELLYDSQKLFISFTSDNRVDFRELLKELTSEYKYRIELKKIGPRDASKIIGGLGVCGRELCCSNHLIQFDKVSIKMAKNQNLALNPEKINGQCGKFLCCLAYEDSHYSLTAKKMPNINSEVITPDGKGICVYNNILKEEVTVRLRKGDVISFCKYKMDELTKKNNFNTNKIDKCPKSESCPKRKFAKKGNI